MLEFGKKRGASMVNVLIFFMMAMMVAAQTFFFSASSMETTAAQTEAISRSFLYERYLYEALEVVRKNNLSLAGEDLQRVSYATGDGIYDSSDSSDLRNTKAFFEQRRTDYSKTGNNVCYEIYDLNYHFKHAYKNMLSDDRISTYRVLVLDANPSDSSPMTSWQKQISDGASNNSLDTLNQMAFPSMGENYYLIRVFEKYIDEETDRQKRRGQRLMYQVVVQKNGTDTPSVISFQEVWY